MKCCSFYRKLLETLYMGKLQTDKRLADSVLHGRLSFFDNQKHQFETPSSKRNNCKDVKIAPGGLDD